jgi:hypothetical protein
VESEWRLLYVRPRLEKSVAQQLQSHDIEAFLPSFRIQNRHRTIELPLFPGYLFCKCATFRGVPRSLIAQAEWVRECEHNAIEQDVQKLRHVLNSGLRYGPWSYLENGTPAVAMDGPLAGVAGFVLNRNRFVIPVKSVLRSVIIDVRKPCRLASADSNHESSSAA